MEHNVDIKFAKLTLSTCRIFVTTTVHPLQFLLILNSFYHVQLSSILIFNFIKIVGTGVDIDG